MGPAGMGVDRRVDTARGYWSRKGEGWRWLPHRWQARKTQDIGDRMDWEERGVEQNLKLRCRWCFDISELHRLQRPKYELPSGCQMCSPPSSCASPPGTSCLSGTSCTPPVLTGFSSLPACELIQTSQSQPPTGTRGHGAHQFHCPHPAPRAFWLIPAGPEGAPSWRCLSCAAPLGPAEPAAR